jgi:hypothetical protein
MKIPIRELFTEVERLLKESGFPANLYLIQMHEECVAVHFDKKEAVDYFRGDFDYSFLANTCILDYKRVGKRHAAYIYNL